jgi:hypothetical protein
MENGIIQLSRERPNRISLENAEVVQLILRRPLNSETGIMYLAQTIRYRIFPFPFSGDAS